MKFGGLEQVTWREYEIALSDLSIPGDDKALEELGYIRSAQTLQQRVKCGKESAALLGIDTRTPVEIRRQEALDYYEEEFFQNGVTPLSEEQQKRNEQGLRLVRDTLEGRCAS